MKFLLDVCSSSRSLLTSLGHDVRLVGEGDSRASDFELARRIMTALNTFTAEEMTNQLLYL